MDGSTVTSGRRMESLQVDWLRCDAHGLCAELLPEVISLDDWGYPFVGGPVPEHLHGFAERAVAACPALALRLERLG
ncbi:MAG: ferredoxin [Candidatus Nanopelagicales bacterium]